jgi:hypothetical protein
MRFLTSPLFRVWVTVRTLWRPEMAPLEAELELPAMLDRLDSRGRSLVRPVRLERPPEDRPEGRADSTQLRTPVGRPPEGMSSFWRQGTRLPTERVREGVGIATAVDASRAAEMAKVFMVAEND